MMFGRKAALPVFTIVDADPMDPLAALRAQEAAAQKRRDDFNRAQDYIMDHTLARQGLFPPNPELDAMPSEQVYDKLLQGVAIHDLNEDKPVDWRELLNSHLQEAMSPVREVLPLGSYFEDTSWRMPQSLLDNMMAEIKGIMNDPNVKWIQFDDDGNVIEES